MDTDICDNNVNVRDSNTVTRVYGTKLSAPTIPVQSRVELIVRAVTCGVTIGYGMDGGLRYEDLHPCHNSHTALWVSYLRRRCFVSSQVSQRY